MKMNEARITENGAVLLGENIVCDAHSGRPVWVITHAHSDHLLHLEKSLCFCKKVISTPADRIMPFQCLNVDKPHFRL